MPLHPSTRSWEISREHVNIIKVIGKGAFSQVAQATVRSLRVSKGNITVAVKMLKGMMLICESSFLDVLPLQLLLIEPSHRLADPEFSPVCILVETFFTQKKNTL